ncbi:MAG: tetratricopeptide repeat protein [Candidatus Hydrogenedentes bacterium]|nr:tetratricopeptide repeat protein [Candidatus Hydrogenedentota bacterium]
MLGKRRNREIGLTKVIFAILFVGGGIVGVVAFSRWFNHEFIGGAVEASAIDNLERARQLADSGNALEARKLLRPIIARVDNPSVTPKALMLLAKLDLAEDATESALENLRIATEDYPDSADQPIAAARYARLLEDSGETQRALTIYARIRDTAPPELRAPALMGLAREQRRAGDHIAARDLYRSAVRGAPWNSEEWYEAAAALGELNMTLITSVQKTPESKLYRVESGDSLTRIGTKLNTTQGLLMAANGITDPNRLHLGQSLKYTPKDFHIIIERSTCRLFLMDNSGLFKMYRVGLGKSGSDTTLGRYKIGNKEKNPTWFKPGSGGIPPGDPKNELGSRWMPLVPEETSLPRDLGIHGTIAPETIGKYASQGCPRLLNEDVEELYDVVVRSTPVTIVETYTPDRNA